MADGGGSIGGGSVYVKFHLGSEKNPTSKVELNDEAKTSLIRFIFPHTVDLSKVIAGQQITVTTEQLKGAAVKVEWDHKAGESHKATA